VFGKRFSQNRVRSGSVDCLAFAPSEKIREFVIDLEDDNRPYISVNIFESEVVGLLDSGSMISVLGSESLTFVRSFNLKLQKLDENIRIKTADGTKLDILGFVNVPINFNNKFGLVKCFVVPGISRKLILGMDFWSKFNIKIVFDVNSVEISPEVSNEDHEMTEGQKSILEEVKSYFILKKGGVLGQTNVITHTIDTGNSPAVRSTRPPLWSPQIQKEVYAELDKMISEDIIEPSISPWVSPLVPVRKSNGTLRLCLDSRKVNAVTVRDNYPLPHINRILGRLEKSTYLSSIDLSQAFHQIPLDDTRVKTAFIIPGRGLFQYKRLPFGLVNSPMTMARCMDTVLGYDLEPKVFVYLDDIVVCSESFEEHIALLKEVAHRLLKANLTINIEKSRFCQKQIKYLGYILGKDGLKPDLDKVSAVVNYKTPTTKKEVRRLMGMANYYRRFISNFSSIVAPITDLTKKKVQKFVWTADAQRALEELKSRLVSAPVLSNPDFSLPFTIQSDASDHAAGATLTQEIDGRERVIAYFSQKFSSTQRKYGASERECLGVVLAIEKFRPYIEGTRFFVQTDCAAVTYIKNLKADGNSRLSRWAMKLQQYDMELFHKKGPTNIVPDALSRAVEVLDVSLDWYDKLKKSVKDAPEKYPLFKIVDDVLYKFVKSSGDLSDLSFDWKEVVRVSERLDIIKKIHDENAHLGFVKTLDKIKRKYYWPKMGPMVKLFISNCETCKASKPLTQCTTPPMGKQKLADEPWQMISVDYLGPFPRSKTGNTYLLVVTDWFSKSVILKPFRAAESKSLKNFMENGVFLNKGVPEILLSDNGPQFVGREFRKLLKEYKVDHWLNASYHPQVNPAERVNKVIVSALKSYVGKDQSNWDLALPKIECAIRTSIHQSTNLTPFFIEHGREMRCSGEEHKIIRNTSELTPEEIEANRLNLFGKIFDKVKAGLDKAYKESARRYNLRTRKQPKFKKGDQIWRKNHKLSNKPSKYCAKLAPRYIKGIVSEIMGADTYEISDVTGRRAGVFHVSDLKT
jgi:transposase InsO family protein